MRVASAIVLLAAVAATVATAGAVDNERATISLAAQLMAGAPANDAFVAALQRLASVLGDAKATSELHADSKSDEFHAGLRALLEDVNRAMWVFGDDAPTLENLRSAAKRIRAAL